MEDTTQGKIWRINMKTDGIYKFEQQGVFDFCVKEGIIGIGWSRAISKDNFSEEVTNPKEIQTFIWNLLKDNNKKTRGFSTASNIIVDRMNIGDYVWTRVDSLYKLAKITSEAKYKRNNEEYIEYDIGFYREVEYYDQSFHISEVPGKIIASFSASSTVQNVTDKEGQLFSYSDSLFRGDSNFKINLEDWTEFFTAEDIEEIVGLYLQVKFNLYVYTSTNKRSTEKIEFELVDENGNLYGVQVKSGEVSLSGIDYEEKSKEMKVFLFASNNEVNTNNNPNIIHITVSEVTRFIEEYKHILPKRISSWL